MDLENLTTLVEDQVEDLVRTTTRQLEGSLEEVLKKDMRMKY